MIYVHVHLFSLNPFQNHVPVYEEQMYIIKRLLKKLFFLLLKIYLCIAAKKNGNFAFYVAVL